MNAKMTRVETSRFGQGPVARKRGFFVFACIFELMVPLYAFSRTNTTVTIVGEDFYINGKPTYAGRNWRAGSARQHDEYERLPWQRGE